MQKDFTLAALAIGAIALVGYAYIEGSERDRTASQLESLKLQNQQLQAQNQEVLTRYLELQQQHQSFKDGVIYGK